MTLWTALYNFKIHSAQFLRFFRPAINILCIKWWHSTLCLNLLTKQNIKYFVFLSEHRTHARQVDVQVLCHCTTCPQLLKLELYFQLMTVLSQLNQHLVMTL